MSHWFTLEICIFENKFLSMADDYALVDLFSTWSVDLNIATHQIQPLLTSALFTKITWNKLPDYVKEPNTLNIFKNSYDDHVKNVEHIYIYIYLLQRQGEKMTKFVTLQWPPVQRWEYPIHNGTLKYFIL